MLPALEAFGAVRSPGRSQASEGRQRDDKATLLHHTRALVSGQVVVVAMVVVDTIHQSREHITSMGRNKGARATNRMPRHLPRGRLGWAGKLCTIGRCICLVGKVGGRKENSMLCYAVGRTNYPRNAANRGYHAINATHAGQNQTPGHPARMLENTTTPQWHGCPTPKGVKKSWP